MTDVQNLIEEKILDIQREIYGCCYPDEKCNPASVWSPYTAQNHSNVKILKEVLEKINK